MVSGSLACCHLTLCRLSEHNSSSGWRCDWLDGDGGQEQAGYRKASLFIFDEFSSSLDPETEHRLFNDILALNTTVLTVTHRLGNIKEFDRIIVMSAGKVIENGDFAALMSHRGKFYDMWHAQFKSVMAQAV